MIITSLKNPVLVEAWRGNVVESRHTGAIAVADSEGRLALSLGDVERPIFPRSAVKALQALVLVESGAADHYALTGAQLALACASHNGEPEHVTSVERILARLGLDETALRCGAHPPIDQAAAAALFALIPIFVTVVPIGWRQILESLLVWPEIGNFQTPVTVRCREVS